MLQRHRRTGKRLPRGRIAAQRPAWPERAPYRAVAAKALVFASSSVAKFTLK